MGWTEDKAKEMVDATAKHGSCVWGFCKTCQDLRQYNGDTCVTCGTEDIPCSCGLDGVYPGCRRHGTRS